MYNGLNMAKHVFNKAATRSVMLIHFSGLNSTFDDPSLYAESEWVYTLWNILDLLRFTLTILLIAFTDFESCKTTFASGYLIVTFVDHILPELNCILI